MTGPETTLTLVCVALIYYIIRESMERNQDAQILEFYKQSQKEYREQLRDAWMIVLILQLNAMDYNERGVWPRALRFLDNNEPPNAPENWREKLPMEKLEE